MDFTSFCYGFVAACIFWAIIEIILREKRIRSRRHDRMSDMIASWRHRARRCFYDADGDKSTITARDALVHDAIIYANCANELSAELRQWVEYGKEIK